MPTATLLTRARAASSATASRPRHWRGGVLAAAALAAGVWALYLGRPLQPDEAGYTIIAAQWHPGTSLYGNYWVGRPPLLITLFELAAGDRVTLRLLAVVVVAVTVALAGAVGRAAAPTRPRAPLLAAVTAAIFLTTPLFGASEVDGELLAAPFTLLGLLGLWRGLRSERLGWWALAGAAGVAAGSVKQSMLEVLVAGCAVVLWLALVRRQPRAALARGGVFLASGAAALGLLLVWAGWHGTTPGQIWDAVVTFRTEAAGVIARSAPETNTGRAWALAEAALLSGAVPLLAVSAWDHWRSRQARPVGAEHVLVAAVVAWEAFAVVAGGNYWHHYLIGLVPGLVVVAARLERWVVPILLLSAGSTVVASVVHAVGLTHQVVPSERAVDYVIAHKHPGDTAVVAFGDPAILQAVGMSSPYPQLWSLPVRVLDPHLTDLTAVLKSPGRPRWVLVAGTSLATWGVDASTADAVLAQDYVAVGPSGDWQVYRARSDTGG